MERLSFEVHWLELQRDSDAARFRTLVPSGYRAPWMVPMTIEQVDRAAEWSASASVEWCSA
jgi:hypothetical protein